jgi:hypothetical protein
LFVGLNFSSAQEQIWLAKLNILEAKIDNVDRTDWYLQQQSYTVFYISENGQFCLANVCPGADSQSYGSISMWSAERFPETADSYATEVYTFRWSYANSYDSHTGSALCTLYKVFKPNAVVYELRMVVEDMTTLVFKGYMDRSINTPFN